MTTCFKKKKVFSLLRMTLLEQFILIVIFIYEATASVASMEATPL
jgi:hypothetical protein